MFKNFIKLILKSTIIGNLYNGVLKLPFDIKLIKAKTNILSNRLKLRLFILKIKNVLRITDKIEYISVKILI